MANRTLVIAGLAPVEAAGSIPTLVHVVPASSDVASVAQEPATQPCPHAAPVHACAPRTNPCVAETNVTEAGRNPASEAGAAVGVATGALEAAGVDGDAAGADDDASDVTGAGEEAAAEVGEADDAGALPVGVV